MAPVKASVSAVAGDRSGRVTVRTTGTTGCDLRKTRPAQTEEAEAGYTFPIPGRYFALILLLHGCPPLDIGRGSEHAKRIATVCGTTQSARPFHEAEDAVAPQFGKVQVERTTSPEATNGLIVVTQSASGKYGRSPGGWVRTAHVRPLAPSANIDRLNIRPIRGCSSARRPSRVTCAFAWCPHIGAGEAFNRGSGTGASV